MTALRNEMQVTGGYEGPALLQAEYLGLGMIIVLVAGVVAWRRDRRLWFFGALGGHRRRGCPSATRATGRPGAC